MTTKVTIDAHAGWPVRVQKIGPAVGGLTEEVIDAGSVREVYVHSGCQLLITEVQMTNGDDAAAGEHIMQFFAWQHLPPHLQPASAPFGLIAQMIVETMPRNPERTVALRKLLEAKDAAVRARLAA